MVKTIDTLVPDLQALLANGIEGLDQSLVDEFGKRVSEMASSRLKREPRDGRLRMSNIGRPCVRQLWYDYHDPNGGEKLSGDTYLKFLYGDLIEELVLFLATACGHKVEGQQDDLELSGIRGHRDCVIDGVLVDVKSASTYSFQKFKGGLRPDDDNFGYITQLQSYLHASQSDPLVTDKHRGAFLVVDKTLGHICLDFHEYRNYDWEGFYERRKTIVGNPKETPPRAFSPVPDGKSGNEKLPTACSYCSRKWDCWPNLRGFAYSTGPTYLTTVMREPNVPEFKP